MKKIDVVKVVYKYFECENSLNRKSINKSLSDNSNIVYQTPICPTLQKTYYLFGVIPFFRITKYDQHTIYRSES